MANDLREEVREIIRSYRRDGEKISPEEVVEQAYREHFNEGVSEAQKKTPHYRSCLQLAVKLLSMKYPRSSPGLSRQAFVGSTIRVQLVATLLPLIRRERMRLWGNAQPLSPLPPFQQTTKELDRALSDIWLWLREGGGVTNELQRDVYLDDTHSESFEMLFVSYHWIDAWDRLWSVWKGATKNSQRLVESIETLYRSMSLYETDGSGHLANGAAYLFDWVHPHQIADLMLTGAYPELRLAWGSSYLFSTDPGPPKHLFEGIHITVTDPENVSPTEVAKLYRRLRRKHLMTSDRNGSMHLSNKSYGAPLSLTSEALMFLELEMILDEAERRRSLGEKVSASSWTWRPGPTQLLNEWKKRAEEFRRDPEEINSRQAIQQFQARTSMETYIAALDDFPAERRLP